MLSILSIKFIILLSFFIFFMAIFLSFLQRKKLILHPITVYIHEIKKPNKLPNATVFIAIKTESGKAGIIDSIDIINDPTITLKNILFVATKF